MSNYTRQIKTRITPEQHLYILELAEQNQITESDAVRHILQEQINNQLHKFN
jgi:sulfite reductase beta subunit-like hemoprotein